MLVRQEHDMLISMLRTRNVWLTCSQNKNIMSVDMLKCKQNVCWHAHNDMSVNMIVCQKHKICEYVQVTEALYARIDKLAE